MNGGRLMDTPMAPPALEVCQEIIDSLRLAVDRGIAAEVLADACWALRVDPVRLRDTLAVRWHQAEATKAAVAAEAEHERCCLRAENARLEQQNKALRLALEVEFAVQSRMATSAVCAHCGVVVPLHVVRDHWRTCEKHPARHEIRALVSRLREQQDKLSRWAGCAWLSWVAGPSR